jgi:uncharacterized membrane protein YkvA (DUF1232 family)
MYGLFGFLFRRAVRLVYLLRHPSVPFWLKLIPFVAIIYVIFPHDFLKDFVPVIGWIDDFWVFTLSIGGFLTAGSRYASRGNDPNGNTITTTYSVVESDEEKKEDPSN